MSHLALAVKSQAQTAQANRTSLTATIPPSPAPAAGDVVLVVVGITPRTPDSISGPAGWAEKAVAFFGDGFAVGKIFARAWTAGLANPTFTWSTRTNAGVRTVVLSGAQGLLPNNVSLAVIPLPAPVPGPVVGDDALTLVIGVDATNAVQVTGQWFAPTGTSQTTERVHGTAG